MRRSTLIILILLLLASGVILAVWQSWENETLSNNKQSNLALPISVEETNFKIKLPEGWNKDTTTHFNKSQITFRDKNGFNMFSVFIDDPDVKGAVSTFDSLWSIKAKGDGVVLTEKSKDCRNIDATPYTGNSDGHKVVSFNKIIFFCEKNDNENHIGLYGDTPEKAAKINGHQYYFVFVSFDNSIDGHDFLGSVIPSFSAN